MYEFPHYSAPSPATLVDLVRTHPFALVISAPPQEGSGSGETTGAPEATHTPVILDPTVPVPDSLDGVTLLGHIARVNPQWRAFTPDSRVLIVFSGPDGYVSPTAYGYNPAVPTWDYAAVHVTARLELVDDPVGCMEIVTKTVTALEDLEVTQWNPHASTPVFERIVEHVVGFRLHIESTKAVFKLSQDMPADVRSRVAAASRSSTRVHGDLAGFIEVHGPDDGATAPESSTEGRNSR